MFGIGMPEMLLILAIALIVIGPKKLPDLAKSLGRTLREFKKATSELKDSLEIDSELQDVKKSFSDISSDIKDSLTEDQKPSSRQEQNQQADNQIAALEESYDSWKQNSTAAIDKTPPDEEKTVDEDQNSTTGARKERQNADKEGSEGNG